MKKNHFLMAALLWLLGCNLWAQTSDSARVQPPGNYTDTIVISVNGNKIIILADQISNLNGAELNSAALEIITLSKDLLQHAQNQMDSIEMQLKSGAITEEQAEEKIEALEDWIEEKMNALAQKIAAAENIELEEQSEDDVDKWISDWFEDDELEEDANDFIHPKKAQKKAKKFQKQLRSYGALDLHWGLNSLMEDGLYIPGGNEELNTWGSNQFTLGFNRVNTLGPDRSLFKIKYGLSFSWHRFTLEGFNAWEQSANAMEIVNLPNTNSSRLHVNYVSIPVMLLLDSSRNIKSKKGWIIGVGGYAGLRTRSRVTRNFNDAVGNEVDMRTKGNFFINDFRYGAMAQVGVGKFRITAEYDLNNFFRDNRGPVNNRAAVTIGWEL